MRMRADESRNDRGTPGVEHLRPVPGQKRVAGRGNALDPIPANGDRRLRQCRQTGIHDDPAARDEQERAHASALPRWRISGMYRHRPSAPSGTANSSLKLNSLVENRPAGDGIGRRPTDSLAQAATGRPTAPVDTSSSAAMSPPEPLAKVFGVIRSYVT